jgi:hypothetical protein
VSIPLADGPAMYFGGTIMTFALPLGAFIVISIALFYLFRSAHSGPKLKYLTTAPFASVGTREPGQAPAPAVVAAAASEPAAVAAAVEDPESPVGETIAPPEPAAAPETTEGGE